MIKVMRTRRPRYQIVEQIKSSGGRDADEVRTTDGDIISNADDLEVMRTGDVRAGIPASVRSVSD